MDALILGLVALLALAAGLAAGLLLGGRRRGAPSSEQAALSATATSQAVAPVKESLDRFDVRLRELESHRVARDSQLRQQIESVRLTGESLRRETASLATALRRPQVRGQWGEMHLKRAVELAGMVEHCDFELQASVRTSEETLLRPDLVVRLAGDKRVVVDSKVPLDAFLDAGDADDDAAQQDHLRRHAGQLRAHVDGLASKAYWRQLDHTPEFVVLFVPGESFLSHALEVEPDLIEYAFRKQVVLATPTTLIALLRTVAYAWTEARLADNARDIQRLGLELFDRISTVGGHLDKLGKSLSAAVTGYNGAVASLESRVLVSARKLGDLGVTSDELPSPRLVEQSARPLTAPELTEADAPTTARRAG